MPTAVEEIEVGVNRDEKVLLTSDPDRTLTEGNRPLYKLQIERFPKGKGFWTRVRIYNLFGGGTLKIHQIVRKSRTKAVADTLDWLNKSIFKESGSASPNNP